jgi:DNA invertase Pin-like site-specific DNA recombinase
VQHTVLSVAGLKGTISEMEVASFRERAQAAILQKAQRGALIRRAAIGYVKGPDDRLEKDPDARVRDALDLIFRKFAELGSVRQVYLVFVYRAGAQPREALLRRRREGVSIRLTSSIEKTSGS